MLRSSSGDVESLPLVSLYHERQSRMFCGMHAINNLVRNRLLILTLAMQLQLPEHERYDKNTMDAIADEMHEREKQVYAEMSGHRPNIKNTHKSKILMLYVLHLSKLMLLAQWETIRLKYYQKRYQKKDTK
jgi:hypothetical protein